MYVHIYGYRLLMSETIPHLWLFDIFSHTCNYRSNSSQAPLKKNISSLFLSFVEIFGLPPATGSVFIQPPVLHVLLPLSGFAQKCWVETHFPWKKNTGKQNAENTENIYLCFVFFGAGGCCIIKGFQWGSWKTGIDVANMILWLKI